MTMPSADQVQSVAPEPNNSEPESFAYALVKALPLLANWKASLSVAFAFGSITVAGFGLQSLTPSHACLTGQTAVSLADYERLRQGMTLTDSQATLGRATEVSQTKSTSTYEWRNCDNSLISATFDQGRLIGKSQSGLR